MSDTATADAPIKNNFINLIFIIVTLTLSISSLAFYSLWRASELVQSTNSVSNNQSTIASDLVGTMLPTSKPPTPSFIYPPSGENQNEWQTIKSSFQTAVSFEMAYPKALLSVKANDVRTKENFWQPLLKYYFFISEADRKAWSDCSKKYAMWNSGLQIPSSTNSASYKAPPCKPSSFELFNLSFDTVESPQVNSSQSMGVTSANSRSWSISNLIENGEGGEYGYEAKTILKNSGLIIQIFLTWPNKEALDRTESILGYDSKTLLNNLLTQMNFGENGMYGNSN